MAEIYIPLSAAIEAVWKVKVTPNASIFDALKRCIEEEMKHITPADVAPVRRGRWTREDYEPCGHDYICSECKDKNDRASAFCPNCGADMREETG